MPDKRKRGRPTGARYNIQIHVFLDETTAELLADMARDRETSQSALVRELIRREAGRSDISLPYSQSAN